MRCRLYFLLLVTLVPVRLWAADIEAIGPVWPVIERDFVAWMQERMQQMLTPERMESLRQEQESGIKAWMKNPPPVPGIERAQEHAVRWYNPTVTLPRDVVDESGNVILKAGTRFNPLSRHSLSRKLVFIDGRDPEQVRWARAYYPDDRIILVAGSPLDVADQLDRHVWYDQKGLLSNRLGIRFVPSVVAQAQMRLRIEEVPIQ